MAIVSGINIAHHLLNAAKERIHNLGFHPELGIVLVGDRADSRSYVERKQKAADAIGIATHVIKLPKTATREEVIEAIEKFAKNQKIDGIMVQLPLPYPKMTEAVLATIPVDKDVDGLNPETLEQISDWRTDFRDPKYLVITKILEEIGQSHKLHGKNFVFVSNYAKFAEHYLPILKEIGCTVTRVNPDHPELDEITRTADVLVSITGRPHFIKANMVKPGAIVIDFGSEIVSGKPQGDVDFDSVKDVASWITPVPGGTGPITVACLLSNVVEAAERHTEKDSSK